MTDYSMTEEQWKALAKVADLPGGRGEDFSLACNADPDTDRIHVRRVGFAGSKLRARVVVAVYTEDDDGTETLSVGYLSAAEARQYAAALLNVADDIDGVTPLTFLPRGVPEAEEPTQGTQEPPAALTPGSFATVTGNHAGDVTHYFEVGQVVEVINVEEQHAEGPVAKTAAVDGSRTVQWVSLTDLAPYEMPRDPEKSDGE